jgi:hypothetical protein
MAEQGKCLCGAVKVTAKTINPNLGACHCGMCRKWNGGPSFSVDCGPEVEFEGRESIGIYHSSAWAQREFCKQCGTHLFYQLKGNLQYFVSAGLFDNIETYHFNHQIFIDDKPNYYSFENKTKNLTGAEVLAKFS